MLERQRQRRRRARSDPAPRRLSRLHDVGGLDSAIRTRRSGGCAAKALAEGWTHFKVKVGGAPADDARRVGLVRDEIGPGQQADDRREPALGRRTRRSSACARSSRYDLWWIEEPTSPDDVLGHAAIAKGVAPVGVATGEHAANRVIFKQLLQATAISFCQIDSCRLGGVNENLAVILMAAKFGVPVCPHAGGVGLCELVQHLSMFDYIARVRPHGRSRHRVRRSPARALRRSGRHPQRPLHARRAVPVTAARCTPRRCRSTLSLTVPSGARPSVAEHFPCGSRTADRDTADRAPRTAQSGPRTAYRGPR